MQQHNTHWRFVLLSTLVIFALTLHTGQIALAEDQKAGAKLYQQRCASCHGAELQGQPNWQRPNDDGTMPAPPLLSRTTWAR